MTFPLVILLYAALLWGCHRGPQPDNLLTFHLVMPPQARLSAAEAQNHVGQLATVCGTVVSARYAEKSNRKPTFLNLDKAYPNHIFTAIIFEADRAKFGEPEKELNGKKICVTGKIEAFQGKPEIVLKDKGQLKAE